jgi:hypothetical protein
MSTKGAFDKSEKKKKDMQTELEKEKARKLQNSLLSSAKMVEEELKYKNNEDFTAFVR